VFPIIRRFPVVTADAVAAGIDRIGRRRGEFFIPVNSHRFPPTEPPLIRFSIDELTGGKRAINPGL
jgi:hypothetical protein